MGTKSQTPFKTQRTRAIELGSGIALLAVSIVLMFKLESVPEFYFQWTHLFSSSEIQKVRVVDIAPAGREDDSENKPAVKQVKVLFRTNEIQGSSYILNRHDSDLEREWFYARVPSNRPEHSIIIDGKFTPNGVNSLLPFLSLILGLALTINCVYRNRSRPNL